MERLKGELRTIREKCAGYALPDKLWFIWEYYKIPLTAIVAALLFGCFFAYRYATVPGDSYLYCMFSNTYAELGDGSDFYKGFVSYAGLDLREKTLTFNASNYCNPAKATYGDSYYETLISLLDSGTLDVLVMGEEGIEAIGAVGRLRDLSGEGMGDFCERWKDRLVYATPVSEEYGDEPVPVAVDLSGTPLVGEHRAYPDGAALGFGAESKRLEMAEKFLDYLFEGAE